MKRRKMIWILVLTTVLVNFAWADKAKDSNEPAKKKKEIVWAIKDDPNLPRVLLIGDSISIGYTLPVRELLKGKANVHRPLQSDTQVDNCGPTTKGLKKIDQWLGDQPWDVIHFNFGLHDLVYLDKEGKRTDPNNGVHQVPLDQYLKNLETIIKRLEKTNAKLIFATTTPVPDGAKSRIAGEEIEYNKAAVKLIKKHNIAIDDLYAHAMKKIKDIQLPQNVHFTGEGSKYLAEKVAGSIQKALLKEKADPS